VPIVTIISAAPVRITIQIARGVVAVVIIQSEGGLVRIVAARAGALCDRRMVRRGFAGKSARSVGIGRAAGRRQCPCYAEFALVRSTGERFMSLVLRLLAALLLAAASFGAAAQAYPAKPIRLLIPFPPGGTTDIVGRLVADELGRQLGQPVVVENRGGGGGAIGAVEVARSAPDGYTLGMATVSTMAVNPACNPKLPYKSPDDFALITNLAAVPNVIAVNPQRVTAQNMADFIKWLKANPGRVSYASSGTCGIGHMMGELFKVASGTFIVHIPYRGAGPALNDVLAGQVEVLFDNIPSSLPHIQGGRLRALAVAAPKRLDVLPSVPTLAELNLAAVNDQVWYGLIAPAKTPDAIVQRVHDAAVKVLEMPEIRDKLRQQGAAAVGNTPEQFRAQIVAERDKMINLVKRQGIKLEQ
jgi:tripartite-type tricarboxylate transporter receptor subunit TctC